MKEFLDAFDEAVAEECISITMSHDSEGTERATAILVMTGMAFSASVRKCITEKLNYKEEE